MKTKTRFLFQTLSSFVCLAIFFGSAVSFANEQQGLAMVVRTHDGYVEAFPESADAKVLTFSVCASLENPSCKTIRKVNTELLIKTLKKTPRAKELAGLSAGGGLLAMVSAAWIVGLVHMFPVPSYPTAMNAFVGAIGCGLGTVTAIVAGAASCVKFVSERNLAGIMAGIMEEKKPGALIMQETRLSNFEISQAAIAAGGIEEK